MKVSTGTLGFPRMGPKRELKFALEKYWRNDINQEDLVTIANQIEEQAWMLQKQASIEHITVGDYYLYDGILQWVEMLGIVPQRFHFLNHHNANEPFRRLFAMARGINDAPALSTFFL
jgi:5-methyltetrahydropteroyltriglutamate--homocysteine methyltransferase